MNAFLKKHFLYSDSNFHSLVLLLALIVYVVTAYNSHGYIRDDEHYQIIEFAGVLLGTTNPEELPWEYDAQVRPTIQPILGFALIKASLFFGINNPYHQVFILRLFSAILSLLIIRYFVEQNKKLFTKVKSRKAFYILSYFLWFIPVISVRFSSETWSGIIFLLSLSVLHDPKIGGTKPYLTGLLLGLSFLFRFQMLFAAFGVLLWLLLIKKNHILYFAKIALGFTLVVLLGFILDSWYYGDFVLTQWNYFYENVIAGKASSFGTQPWPFYFYKLIFYTQFIVGIPLLIAFAVMVFYKPKNIYLWIIIPFVLVHTLIPHKEERFLFPLVYMFPAVLVLALDKLTSLLKSTRLIKAVCYGFLGIFITVNLVGIAAMSQKSAGYGRIEITKFIHDNYAHKKINFIFLPLDNPYNPGGKLPANFYYEDQLEQQCLNNLCDLNANLIVPDAENVLVISKYFLSQSECKEIIKDKGFVFKKQSVPGWILWLNKFYKGYDSQRVLEIYHYEKDQNAEVSNHLQQN